MNEIIAIRYIDACYSEKKKLSSSKLITHYSIGKLISATKDFLVISFTEKDGIPWRGLLLPHGALVFDKKNKISEVVGIKNKIKKIKKKTSIGIFWKDLIYFENGVLPKSYSLMYTEGELFSVTSSSVIIKNPETVNITPGKLANHPKTRPFFYMIPKHLITDIEVYGK